MSKKNAKEAEEKMDVFVRGVNKNLWKEFRGLAVKEGKKTAQALEEALKLWIEEQKKREKGRS